MTNPDHAWRLLRLAELLRRLEGHQDQALTIVHRIYPNMSRSFRRTITAMAIERLKHEVTEIARLVEQLEAVAETLPANEAVAVTYGEVRRSAEHVLREVAMLDPATVKLALQLLERSTGFPALAEALRSSGAYTSWEATTAGELVGAPRGVSPQLARRVATAARIAPGTDISGCRSEEVAQLADQLDLHATG